VIGRTKGDLKKEVSRLEAKLVGRLRKSTADSVAKHSQLEEELWAKTAQVTQLLEAHQASGDGGSGAIGPKEMKRLEAKLMQRVKSSDDKFSARLQALEAKLGSPA
jgi:phage host-nuclease inhibitor protein Gam